MPLSAELDVSLFLPFSMHKQKCACRAAACGRQHPLSGAVQRQQEHPHFPVAWLLLLPTVFQRFLYRSRKSYPVLSASWQGPAKVGRKIGQEGSLCLRMGTVYMGEAPASTINAPTHSSSKGLKRKKRYPCYGVRGLLHKDLSCAGTPHSTHFELGPWVHILHVHREYPYFWIAGYPFLLIEPISSLCNPRFMEGTWLLLLLLC